MPLNTRPGRLSGRSIRATLRAVLRSAGRKVPRAGSEPDETGATLILVLAFLVVAGLIVGGLLGASMNDLRNTSNFASARALQSDAQSATNAAVQSIRYAPLLSTAQTLNASPPSVCWGTGTSSEVTDAGNTIAVWCSTAWAPTSADTRVVTFSACQSSLTASASAAAAAAAAAACASDPMVQAVVTFDDYPPGLNPPNQGECVVYCGTSMTVNRWLQFPIVPTVTGIATSGGPATGPISGGTLVTLTGSGFVSNTTVNFVEESGGIPTSSNTVVTVSPSSITSNSVSVYTPPVTAVTSLTAGTGYFVTVTTPTGTTPYGSNIFTYIPSAPTVTGLSITSGTACTSISGGVPPGVVACGPTAGGTLVTITGTNFVSGATVSFVDTATQPNIRVASPYVTVVSDTSITAVAPAVIAGSPTPGSSPGSSYPGPTYSVIVTADGSSASANNEFYYYPIFPTVASLAPSGQFGDTGGTQMTVTGTGFFSSPTANASVQFVEESGGAQVSPNLTVSATNVVVVNSTTITCKSPDITAGSTFFVEVTTPNGGTSSNTPVYTYQS